MIGRAVGAGWNLVGEWLGSACGLVTRIREHTDPLVRVLGLGPGRSHSPTPPVSQPPSPRPEEQAREAKYYLGTERLAVPAPSPRATVPVTLVDREPGDLPRAYGRDRLVLLVRDPWWLFAYWELTPTSRIETLRNLGAEAEGAVEVLRVYDVTFIDFTGNNAWTSIDIEPTPGAESWYINVWKPAASYCAEIGVRTRAGGFVPIMRSNTVTTSRPQPSPDTTVRWVVLRPRGLTVEGGESWDGARVEHPGRSDGHSPAPPGSSDLHAPRPPAR